MTTTIDPVLLHQLQARLLSGDVPETPHNADALQHLVHIGFADAYLCHGRVIYTVTDQGRAESDPSVANTPVNTLDRIIDRVLADANSLCLDDADDRAALRGLLLSALAPAVADDTDTGARLEAAYNLQRVIEERDAALNTLAALAAACQEMRWPT